MISHRMEKILRNGCSGDISILHYMKVKQEDENVPIELKCTLENNHRVLQEISNDLPPFRDHEHQIVIIPGSTLHNRSPYRYPH